MGSEMFFFFFFFQAEDGIRGGVASRGLGDVYKRKGSLAAEGGVLLVAAVDWVSSFSIIDEGGDLDATVGDSLVLNGRVSGENTTLQWYKNGAAIDGAMSSIHL